MTGKAVESAAVVRAMYCKECSRPSPLRNDFSELLAHYTLTPNIVLYVFEGAALPLSGDVVL